MYTDSIVLSAIRDRVVISICELLSYAQVEVQIQIASFTKTNKYKLQHAQQKNF
eukprot:TRINITY_DN13398_c0_g1_i1.p2 TRINITY_DN13398_c0_g1~~TRINITY_DN13398_c0_g1_i1.p2  ORF type:complete len:54 (+),score=1.25 TRINITY_DN13398_c0_g1_i1:91-252(+)